MAAEPGSLSEFLGDDEERDNRLAAAWEALEVGNADREQGQLILRHLAWRTGFYTAAPPVRMWQGSAEAYQVHCLQHEARRWVFEEIAGFLQQHPDPLKRRY